MAIHADELSMLQASLPEYLYLAELGFRTERPDGRGVLGYPSATLLMCIVDAIGSYYRDDPSFQVSIDNKLTGISEPRHHFRILNSRYFGLNLSGQQVNSLYELCRSPLAHNALLGRGHAIHLGDSAELPFTFPAGQVLTNIPALHAACVGAVTQFLADAPTLVPKSTAVHELHRKSTARGAAPGAGHAPPSAN